MKLKTGHKIALAALIAALPFLLFLAVPMLPRWVVIAKREKGIKEEPGAVHNQRIIGYHASTGGFSSDEVPWCSSFVNWVMTQAGYKGTGSAQAISWADWGRTIDRPCIGAIAVWHWGGGKGHVGFVLGRAEDGRLLILGGNQADQVKVSKYSDSKLIAYVVPENYIIPKSHTL